MDEPQYLSLRTPSFNEIRYANGITVYEDEDGEAAWVGFHKDHIPEYERNRPQTLYLHPQWSHLKRVFEESIFAPEPVVQVPVVEDLEFDGERFIEVGK